MTPLPSEFQALVAELGPELRAANTDEFAAMTAVPRELDPAAFENLDWDVTGLVDGPTAAELCGYSYRKTWEVWRRPTEDKRKAGTATLRDLPAAVDGDGPGGHWELGTVAIWLAIKKSPLLRKPRWPQHRERWPAVADAWDRGVRSERTMAAELGIGVVLANELINECLAAGLISGGYQRNPIPPDEKMLPVARALLTRVPAARAKDVRDALADAGMEVTETVAKRVLLEAGGPRLAPHESDTLAADHIEWRTATLARAARVGHQAVTDATKRCRHCPGPKALRKMGYEVQPGPGEAWHHPDYRAGRGEPPPHEFQAWLTPCHYDEHTALFNRDKVHLVPGLRTPVDKGFDPWAGRRGTRR